MYSHIQLTWGPQLKLFSFFIVPIKGATVNNLGQRIIVEEAVTYKHIGGLEEGSYILFVNCFSRDTREAKTRKESQQTGNYTICFKMQQKV